MSWQQLTLTVSHEICEYLSDYLEREGALAITLLDANDEPIFEPAPGTTPLWQEAKLIALFPQDFALQTVAADLQQQFSLQTSITLLEDQAWERVCMDQFRPECFGEKLWICPSWHEVREPNATIVHLDPGLAFGTGNHPTTRLCLQWLSMNEISNKIVIDYGCGSGILALAALKLGASKVYAVDIDDQALQATKDNALRNQIPMERLIICRSEELATHSADIVIANILANPLIQLASTFKNLLSADGTIVLSGILPEQINEICEAYHPQFSFDDAVIEDSWARLSGIKQSA